MNLLHEKPVSHRSNLPSIPICEREQSDRDRKGQKRETKIRQTGRQEETQRETERKRRQRKTERQEERKQRQKQRQLENRQR